MNRRRRFSLFCSSPRFDADGKQMLRLESCSARAMLVYFLTVLTVLTFPFLSTTLPARSPILSSS